MFAAVARPVLTAPPRKVLWPETLPIRDALDRAPHRGLDPQRQEQVTTETVPPREEQVNSFAMIPSPGWTRNGRAPPGRSALPCNVSWAEPGVIGDALDRAPSRGLDPQRMKQATTAFASQGVDEINSLPQHPSTGWTRKERALLKRDVLVPLAFWCLVPLPLPYAGLPRLLLHSGAYAPWRAPRLQREARAASLRNNSIACSCA